MRPGPDLEQVVESPDTLGFVCDFKKFTSGEIHKNILAWEPNIERLFLNPDGSYSLWQDTNMPVLLESEKVFLQKLNYLHENPVRKNYYNKKSKKYELEIYLIEVKILIIL